MKSGKSKLKRIAFGILRIAVGVYLGLAVLMFLTQSRLVYFPKRDIIDTPESAGLAYESVSFTSADGVTLSGWFVPTTDVAGSKGTILFCHGNAGNISTRVSTVQVFNRMGLSVFIFDYRGFGESKGKPSEEGTYQDAEAARRYLIEERKVSNDELIIVGRSLGGPIAAWLARKHPPKALALENTFTKIGDVAAHHYPWMPVRWLLRYNYNTSDYISGLECPLLVLHSPDDWTVPFKFGRKLYEGAREPKQFLEISGTHNEGFETSGKTYTDGWEKFLKEFAPQNPTAP